MPLHNQALAYWSAPSFRHNSPGCGPLQHEGDSQALGRHRFKILQDKSKNSSMWVEGKTKSKRRWSCNHTHYCIDYICYVTLYAPITHQALIGGDGRYS